MSPRRLSIAAVAALALGFFATPADAASIVLCKAPAPGTGSAGPGRVTMGLSAATGLSNAYQIDRWGCGVFLASDVAEAITNGYIPMGPQRSMIVSGATAATKIGDLPPAAYIVGIVVENETAGSISTVNNAGVKIGTTSGGTDISNGIAVTSWNRASALDASIAKRAFSATQSTAVWVDMAAWTSNRVTVTVLYTFF